MRSCLIQLSNSADINRFGCTGTSMMNINKLALFIYSLNKSFVLIYFVGFDVYDGLCTTYSSNKISAFLFPVVSFIFRPTKKPEPRPNPSRRRRGRTKYRKRK
jgi:hypothetical protein